MQTESLQRLAYLANLSDNDVFYMSQAEGQELVANGCIQVNMSEEDPNRPGAFRVRITQVGHQVLTQSISQPAQFAPPSPPQTNAQTSPPVATAQENSNETPKFAISADVPMPAKAPRSSNLRPMQSKYPYDQLVAVGYSFHVPATEDNPEPHKTMASNVGAANRRYEKPVLDEHGQPVMETVKKKRVVKDGLGNKVKDDKGKLVYETYEENQPKTRPDRKFAARRVDKSDPLGPGVRVYRVE